MHVYMSGRECVAYKRRHTVTSILVSRKVLVDSTHERALLLPPQILPTGVLTAPPVLTSAAWPSLAPRSACFRPEKKRFPSGAARVKQASHRAALRFDAALGGRRTQSATGPGDARPVDALLGRLGRAAGGQVL